MGGSTDEVVRRSPPARTLLIAALGTLVLCALAVFARLGQPSLGLTLEADPEAKVVKITSAKGPSAAIPTPAVLVSMRAGDRSLDLLPSDVIEEPDFFDTYPEMADFFRRQTSLKEIVDANEVTLTVVSGTAGVAAKETEPPATFTVVPARKTAAGALPGAFWFQIVASAIALLVSVWALVLRPRALGVRIFAAMGASIPIFILPAAVYGTRELAIDGGAFRAASSLNHTGANLFGIALVMFFLAYPAQMVKTKYLWIVPGILIPWLFLDIFRIAPDQNLGSRAPIFLEMIGAIVLGFGQLRATRGDPRARVGLRWIGVSVLLGAGMFVFGVLGSSVLGWFPPISQGYSFGFFLLMHVSFAFGLSRHRLFELGEWAYSVMLWVLAGMAVIAIDVVLVTVVETNRALSAGVAILVCGFVYLPIRNWLWSKAVTRRETPEHELLDGILGITFAATAEERTTLWKALLKKLFDPTQLEELEEDVETATVRQEGLELAVPAASPIPALRLVYPWGAKGLFGVRHRELADRLVNLLKHAESRREEYERGVRDERTRIARDMHDDIGASLQSTLHRADLSATRDGVRQAIGDVRSIVHELMRKELALDDVLADMRVETMQRLENAGLEVEWPLHERGKNPKPLPHGVYRHFTSMLRELTSNAIRHSGAKHVRVNVSTEAGRLTMTFADDGKGFDPATVRRGSGLENIERRATTLGGKVTFERNDASETITRLDLPLG